MNDKIGCKEHYNMKDKKRNEKKCLERNVECSKKLTNKKITESFKQRQ